MALTYCVKIAFINKHKVVLNPKTDMYKNKKTIILILNV